MKRSRIAKTISILLSMSLAVSAVIEEAKTEPFIIPDKTNFELKLEQSRKKNGKKEFN